jgi:hypothetical protein
MTDKRKGSFQIGFEILECLFFSGKNHLQRMGILNGIDTAIIAISGGLNPLNAKDAVNKNVEEPNGNIIQSLSSSRSNRNLDDLREEATKLTL